MQRINWHKTLAVEGVGVFFGGGGGFAAAAPPTVALSAPLPLFSGPKLWYEGNLLFTVPLGLCYCSPIPRLSSLARAFPPVPPAPSAGLKAHPPRQYRRIIHFLLLEYIFLDIQILPHVGLTPLRRERTELRNPQIETFSDDKQHRAGQLAINVQAKN